MEGVKTPLLSPMGEVIVGITKPQQMDSLLMRIVDALTQPGRFMDAIRWRVTRCQSLTTPMTVHVKLHINMIEEEPCLVQRLQQQVLETAYQPTVAISKVEAGVVTPLAPVHSMWIWMKNIHGYISDALSLIRRGAAARTVHCQMAINMWYKTVRRKKERFQKNQRSARPKLELLVDVSREILWMSLTNRKRWM